MQQFTKAQQNCFCVLWKDSAAEVFISWPKKQATLTPKTVTLKATWDFQHSTMSHSPQQGKFPWFWCLRAPTFSAKANSVPAWLCYQQFTQPSSEQNTKYLSPTAANTVGNSFWSNFNNILGIELQQFPPDLMYFLTQDSAGLHPSAQWLREQQLPTSNTCITQTRLKHSSKGLNLRQYIEKFIHRMSDCLQCKLFHWMYIKHK